MIRILAFCGALLGAAPIMCLADTIARVNAVESGVSQSWLSGTSFRLSLTDAVPFRVFTLSDPSRLVMDFKEVDWRGVSDTDLMDEESVITAVRFGNFQPGWSRLIADLSEPVLPDDVQVSVDPETGKTVLEMSLKPVSAAEYAGTAGVPESASWQESAPMSVLTPVMDDRFVVVLDPGHGGVDPGAERDGLSEKELMLDVAQELRDLLIASGDVEVVLTRERDVFVSLDRRVAIAHRAGADLFLSLHADALSQGGAQGATVYVLSDEASDTATAHLADRHNRADVLAGVDLTASDDQVTRVLLDIARRETEPRSEALAMSLVAGMKNAGGPMNRRPLRQAGFAVLKSADIPSVLVEVGFLSSKRDLENLRNPEWRSGMIEGIAEAIFDWQAKDKERQALVRQ